MHKLVYMANQIGKFFVSQGDEQAVPGIADHLKKFWDPRMRAQFSLNISTQVAPDLIRRCAARWNS